MQKFVGFARKSTGTLMTAGTGTFAVYQPGTTTPVSVYATDSTVTPISSFTIPVTGKIEFYARNGDIKVVATEGAETVTVDDITILAGLLIGALGSRPAAGSTDRLHLATDRGQLTYDTGSAWNNIGVPDPTLDAIDFSQGADVVATAGTTDVFGGTGNSIKITNASGSPAITALANGNAVNGSLRTVQWSITAGTPSVTHNATSLDLGAGSLTPANGDKWLLRGKGGSNVELLAVMTATSQYWIPAGSTAVGLRTNANQMVTPADLQGLVNSARTSFNNAATLDFTALPSWVKIMFIQVENFSTSGTSALLLQLGTSGGVQTTGYSTLTLGGSVGGTTESGDSTTTSGFVLMPAASMAAAGIYNGLLILMRAGAAATGTWSIQGIVSRTDGTVVSHVAGTKTLSGTLDRVRVTSANGTDTNDAGAIGLAYL